MLDRIKTFLQKLWSRTMRMLVGLAMVITGGTIHAQAPDYPRDITLTWTNPSQYVDGSPIEAGDLESIRIECANQAQPTVLVVNETFPDNGEGAQQSNTWVGVIPNPGNYICYGWAIVVGGISSDASNPATKKYVGTPLPPVILTFD